MNIALRSPCVRLATLALLCWSDAHLASAQPAPSTLAEPFTVRMKVEVQAANRLFSRSVLPGEQVRIGERFFAQVWADQPVYLYVVKYESAEWSSLLYPEAQHTRSSPGQRIRVPEAGGHFVLRDGQGEVHLRILASREAIDATACRELRLPCPLFQVAGRTRGGTEGDKAKKEPPPPPPPPPERAEKRTARDRGGEQRSDEKERVLIVRSDQRGTAWLDFAFKPEDSETPPGTLVP